MPKPRNRLPAFCHYCYMPVERIPSKLTRTHIFCNKLCQLSYFSNPPREYLCKQCGIIFIRKPSGGRHTNDFCTMQCRGLFKRRPLLEKFLAYVDKSRPPCWWWTASCFKGGYGQLSITVPPFGKIYAHRFAFEQVYGPIPEHFEVCHTCDERSCVRNDDVGFYQVGNFWFPRRGHLFLAPHSINCKDAQIKGKFIGFEQHFTQHATKVLKCS